MQYVTNALMQVHIVKESFVESLESDPTPYGTAETMCGKGVFWLGKDLLTDEAADPAFTPCQACIDEADRQFRAAIDLMAKAMGR